MWVGEPLLTESEDGLDDEVAAASVLEDPYVSRVGGVAALPPWVREFDARRWSCGCCGHPLCLLCQVCIPKVMTPQYVQQQQGEVSEGDPILLVLACNRARCQATPERSWQAWRAQYSAPPTPTTTTTTTTTTDTTTTNSTTTTTALKPGTSFALLPCMELDLYDEPEEENPSSTTSIEEQFRLMQHYNERAGLTQDDLTHSLRPLERDLERRVDHAFLAFQQRLSRAPRQALRVPLTPAAAPLWISSENAGGGACCASPCVVCGAPRQFALQLLPTLVYYLKPYEHPLTPKDEGLDFGVVVVYVCSERCDLRRCGNICPEAVYVQPPPSK